MDNFILLMYEDIGKGLNVVEYNNINKIYYFYEIIKVERYICFFEVEV